jgi:hypothetical protein
MPVTVYRLEGENILVANFTGMVDSDLMLQMYEDSAAMLDDAQQALEPPIVRITDFRTVTSTPQAVLDAFMMATSDIPASTVDRRIRPVIVGDNKWSHLAQRMLAKGQQKFEMPIFASMGEALHHARVLLARLKDGS